jgi:branched-chain amino acid transport system ATP-binding protein
MNALEVNDLKVHFGGVKALDGITLSVPARGVHALIGPNGAGKTTLINAITGFYRPTYGSVTSGGRDVTGMPARALAMMGITRTFQNLQVFWTLSVLDNVMAGFNLGRQAGFLRSLVRAPSLIKREAELAHRAMELLATVGLQGRAQDMASGLAYGELKRLEIARALAGQPKLLFLDEPVAGCNASEKRTLGGVIRKVADVSNTCIVLVEHDMRLVMEVSDRVMVLLRGQLLAQGAPAAVRNDPQVVEAYLGHPAPDKVCCAERANDAAR